MPDGESVDASSTGVLLALAAPVGFTPRTRLCISWPTDDGAVHVVGRVERVERVERGNDFRTYIAISFDQDHAELEQWRSLVSESSDREQCTTDDHDASLPQGAGTCGVPSPDSGA